MGTWSMGDSGSLCVVRISSHNPVCLLGAPLEQGCSLIFWSVMKTHERILKRKLNLRMKKKFFLKTWAFLKRKKCFHLHHIIHKSYIHTYIHTPPCALLIPMCFFKALGFLLSISFCMCPLPKRHMMGGPILSFTSFRIHVTGRSTVSLYYTKPLQRSGIRVFSLI